MTWIPLASARPGMVVAAPIRNHEGRVLLERGATLDERLLHVLRAWGVGELSIERGDPPGETAPTPPLDERTARALEAARERFALFPEDPSLALLAEVVRQHIERSATRD